MTQAMAYVAQEEPQELWPCIFNRLPEAATELLVDVALRYRAGLVTRKQLDLAIEALAERMAEREATE